MKIIKKTVLSLIIIAAIIICSGCSNEIEPVSVDNYYLDTTCNISVYATDESQGLDKDVAKQAINAAYKLCAKLEKALSKTIEASDISKLNAAKGSWVTVSDYTKELLKKGLYYSKKSNGVFDITVGGITELWDFHAVEPKLPDENKLAEAAKHVGHNNVKIDGNKVRLLDPKVQVDLGGIAKGYIGDKMAGCLEEKGVTSAIINLGGNIICVGAKSKSKGFVIGVEAPFSDRTEVVGSVEASDQTLVTSGVYERMFEAGGKLYHHILSTETGWPVESDVNSVTIIAGKGHSADCDALSTTCLIMGYKKASELIDSLNGYEAVFVLKDGSIKSTTDAFVE